MLFNYKAITEANEPKEGVFDAVSMDIAITALQRKGLIVVSINPVGESVGVARFFEQFQSISQRDLVIMSRQIATLFEAKVSALDSFKLLASGVDNPQLTKVMLSIADDLQSGISISSAMAKHENAFTPFFVSMVRSGEESGKLNQSFNYLADHLEREYELVSKAKNALIYPAFVIASFIIVMILMLVFVIPKLTDILTETGGDIPIYTKIIIALSQFLLNNGILIIVALVFAGYFFYKYSKSKEGQAILADIKMRTPYVGNLYKMFYLSRFSENMDTLISSGVAMVRSVEITADVVGSDLYRGILLETVTQVKAGNSLSKSLGQYPQMPAILIQMIKIGEETGNLGFVLKTMSRFYKREVDNAVESLVGLIEPLMIVVLGLAVGILLTSVLGPIYNITTGI
ncbi:MAG: type II secretion system F family protein [bacterium]